MKKKHGKDTWPRASPTRLFQLSDIEGKWLYIKKNINIIFVRTALSLNGRTSSKIHIYMKQSEINVRGW